MKNRPNQTQVGPRPDTNKLLVHKNFDPDETPRLSQELVDRLVRHIEAHGRSWQTEIGLEKGLFKATAFSVEDDSEHRLYGGIDAGAFIVLTSLRPCTASTAKNRDESG